jgi:hypothetical protein
VVVFVLVVALSLALLWLRQRAKLAAA